MIERCDDPADERLRDYLSLTDVALRRVREPLDGLFMAEGEMVIRRALEAGYTPRSMLLSDRWLAPLTDIVEEYPEVPFFVAPDDVVHAITGYAVHRGALSAFHRRTLPQLEELLSQASSLVVLEDIVDHTNVGAVFRSAAALGVDAVLVSPRCADPLYRRSVKVSMGAVFSVPWTRAESWPDALGLLSDAGFDTLALTPRGDVSLRTYQPCGKWALVFGTEGAGLSEPALARCNVRVRIPMSSGVDSLNVAAASAVACYALQRSPGDEVD